MADIERYRLQMNEDEEDKPAEGDEVDINDGF